MTCDLPKPSLNASTPAAAWTVEMLAITVDALTRERTGGITTRPMDDSIVLQTRLSIQRYARDIGLNVAVLLVVMLLFIGVLALG